MKRAEPCATCGAKEGPAIFSGDSTCSDICKKFDSGEISREQFESETGRRFNTKTGFFDQFSAAKVLEKVRLEKARLQVSR